MCKILSSIACNLDTDILLASLPLFDEGRVEAIEWSFDTLYNFPDIPSWFTDLLKTFANEKRLIGHGVYFSIFSGRWSNEQQQWLAHLEKLSSEFSFDHISEHFGFMTGENFHNGAPISIPFTQKTLAIGRDRLKRIYNACNCPVGLENLAFSYTLDEVKKHGEFLDLLVEPVNGFIILDLHNIYCQLHNFDISFYDIIHLYPLHRVREIHISGGSWEDSHIMPEKKIRRDTHDDAVPKEVFELLKLTLSKCPNVKYVVLEQIGSGLHTAENRDLFQQDFLKLDAIVQNENSQLAQRAISTFLPNTYFTIISPLEDVLFYAQQSELSTILETANNYEHAKELLRSSGLANTEWETEKWEPFMLETAIAIAQKWKDGFNHVTKTEHSGTTS